jgi:hypothetical protein
VVDQENATARKAYVSPVAVDAGTLVDLTLMSGGDFDFEDHRRRHEHGHRGR